MKNMGGLGSIMSMMPALGAGMGKMKDLDDDQTAQAEKNMARMEAMIYSMTPEERRNPDLLNPSRKHRIARGAGVDISEVNRMVKQFGEMKKMMKMDRKKRQKRKVPPCRSKVGITAQTRRYIDNRKNIMEVKYYGSKNQIKKNGTEEGSFL